MTPTPATVTNVLDNKKAADTTYTVTGLKDESQTYFQKSFPTQSLKDYSGHNDEVDAFRHAYASAVIAYVRDDAVAAALGWAHESINNKDGQPLNEYDMDSFNNRQGRLIADGIT